METIRNSENYRQKHARGVPLGRDEVSFLSLSQGLIFPLFVVRDFFFWSLGGIRSDHQITRSSDKSVVCLLCVFCVRSRVHPPSSCM